MYSTLLVDLFKFLDPFLRNTELASPVMMLYKGTLKVLLVLLHDFPEFLCDYHYGFCDEIPPNCIQMRNLILSAFPRNMRLPDPFTPNLKVDLLAEITLPPRAVINYGTLMPISQFKKDLDAYLKARTPVTFLSELRSNMQVRNNWRYRPVLRKESCCSIPMFTMYITPRIVPRDVILLIAMEFGKIGIFSFYNLHNVMLYIINK